MTELQARIMMLGCLLTAGAALAVTILISRIVSDAGAPMIWFLGFVLIGSGVVQLVLAQALGQGQSVRHMLLFALGAGALMATPMALGYLAVAHVGAGYISLTYAFPILLTWALARLIGLEGANPRRAFAVGLGLAGGMLLAMSKLTELPSGEILWLVLATAMPVVVAGGNIYRSRYWPKGARPLTLSAMTLLMGGLVCMVVAPFVDGAPDILWQSGNMRLIIAIDILVFVIQYIAFFQLQRLGGPVTLSLLGPVAALTGAAGALWMFAEPLPQNFLLAGLLVGAGVVLMLMRRRPVLKPA
ncbi:DMT family transporter [Paracoccus sp. JM45]|uniref:DMT family transporter n=1 Tax=Paracoccus sp. JM45 TaxID=2283626 RepID=UPI000E6D1686|nr:DMT family transporter [Paracoccus sp. JM45]RJE79391.1 DMT family transporter [Paracoccus sp. JM45]